MTPLNIISKKINKIIGDLLKWILIKNDIFTTDQFSNISYSQLGEDLVLKKIFATKQHGFFVDVGAFHPKYYSNTYLLYRKGWRGINIDAMPGSMKIFNKIRTFDKNLEIPIGSKNELLTYYIFEEPAFNGFFSFKPKNIPSRLIKTKKIATYPLKNILDKFVPQNKSIDLLSIDVEGMDYEVLLSNNWKKYLPSVIVVEDIKFSPDEPQKSKIFNLLRKHHYHLHASLPPSLIFIFK